MQHNVYTRTKTNLPQFIIPTVCMPSANHSRAFSRLFDLRTGSSLRRVHWMWRKEVRTLLSTPYPLTHTSAYVHVRVPTHLLHMHPLIHPPTAYVRVPTHPYTHLLHMYVYPPSHIHPPAAYVRVPTLRVHVSTHTTTYPLPPYILTHESLEHYPLYTHLHTYPTLHPYTHFVMRIYTL